MKRKALFLTPLLICGMIACNETEKSAEEIEQEYTPSEVSSDNQVESDENTDNETIENSSTTNDAEYEYIEDYAKLDTKSKLYEALNAENLTDGSSWYAEGTVEFPHTIYNDPNTLNQIRFVWNKDAETLSFIEIYLNLLDEASGTVRQQFVLSEHGIFTGMTLKELYDWNGQKEIKFSGFGWDFGGGVFPQEGSPLANSGLVVRLGLENYADQTYNHLMGDMELSTADEGILEAPIRVDMLTLYIDEPEM
ncbi:hypothetical protein [Parvicella tangerina]|uniref:Lipoprotein n=1 Tax=Parvicella tangerina TaxID=2829795 RepID=A0A916JMC4_9FLAO|nr:hypothetical protein [Parvicella tangerina]CAG5081768.1 hypothetical protein CRYO30217_01723 [Parvicella tangerina]